MKNILSKSTTYYKLLLFFLIFMAGYFIFGQSMVKLDPKIPIREIEAFDDGWTVLKGDGTKEVVNLPGYIYLTDAAGEAASGIVTLEKDLPENLTNDKYFVHWNNENHLKIYVADDLRLEVSNTENTSWGKRQGVTESVWIPLTKEDSGKKLRLVLDDDSSYAVANSHLTTQTAFLYYVMRNGLVEGLVAFLIFTVSIVCFVICVIVERRNHFEVSLKYYSLMAFISSGWLLTNNSIRQYIFPNVGISRNTAYWLVAVLPIPTAMYLDVLQKRRMHKLLLIVETISEVAFIASVLLYGLRIFNFRELKYLIQGSLVAAAILFIVSMTIEMVKKRTGEYWLPALGLFGLSIFSIAQVVIYQRQMTDVYDAVLIEVGLLWSMVLEIIMLVRNTKRAAEEKQDAQNESNLKSAFLANMSHEIRTPINAILGMDELIQRETREERIEEYARQINLAGNNLLSLINNILDFSKLESGKMNILEVDYDVRELLGRLVRAVNQRANRKGLSLKVDIPADFPRILRGDDIRIEQVVSNLLTNAIKYTEKGEVKLRISSQSLEDGKILMHVEVKDTGIGIKPEDKEAMFRSFERLERVKNRNIEGAGLGMGIAVNLLSLMNSKMQMESIYGVGSTFWFDIEQTVVDSQGVGDLEEFLPSEPIKGTRANQASYKAPNAKVLVVDDTIVNLAVAKGLLKRIKVQVTTAPGGKEALDILQQEDFHVILLDHLMPDMDGIETMERIQQMKPAMKIQPKVIMVTANTKHESEKQFASCGFDGFLSKPVAGEILEETIREMLPRELIVKQ